jgi:hypothetical protein
MTDLEVTRLLTRRLRPGRAHAVLPRSFAWDRADHSAKDVVAEWEADGRVERVGEFRSLLVYRSCCDGRGTAPYSSSPKAIFDEGARAARLSPRRRRARSP